MNSIVLMSTVGLVALVLLIILIVGGAIYLAVQEKKRKERSRQRAEERRRRREEALKRMKEEEENGTAFKRALQERNEAPADPKQQAKLADLDTLTSVRIPDGEGDTNSYQTGTGKFSTGHVNTQGEPAQPGETEETAEPVEDAVWTNEYKGTEPTPEESIPVEVQKEEAQAAEAASQAISAGVSEASSEAASTANAASEAESSAVGAAAGAAASKVEIEDEPVFDFKKWATQLKEEAKPAESSFSLDDDEEFTYEIQKDDEEDLPTEVDRLTALRQKRLQEADERRKETAAATTAAASVAAAAVTAPVATATVKADDMLETVEADLEPEATIEDDITLVAPDVQEKVRASRKPFEEELFGELPVETKVEPAKTQRVEPVKTADTAAAKAAPAAAAKAAPAAAATAAATTTAAVKAAETKAPAKAAPVVEDLDDEDVQPAVKAQNPLEKKAPVQTQQLPDEVSDEEYDDEYDDEDDFDPNDPETVRLRKAALRQAEREARRKEKEKYAAELAASDDDYDYEYDEDEDDEEYYDDEEEEEGGGALRVILWIIAALLSLFCVAAILYLMFGDMISGLLANVTGSADGLEPLLAEAMEKLSGHMI